MPETDSKSTASRNCHSDLASHSKEFSTSATDSSLGERTIRDLMGLLALPALWAGRGSEAVVQVMTEAAERLVPLTFSFVNARMHPEATPAHCIRVEGRDLSHREMQEWIDACASWSDQREADARVFVAETPQGEMRIVRFSMGYGRNEGQIWFGSLDRDFPSSEHLAYLRAATSLATNGLQTALANYEREEASRAKDEFLAMLGHELRNPLSPIVTALELLELKNDGELGEEHAIISRQVERVRRLVDDLLDVARITRRKISLDKTVVDLRRVLAEAVDDVRPLLDEHQHLLSTNFPAQEIHVLGDPARLNQVFTNLLTNAAKYTNPGGFISVGIGLEGEKVQISIKDNGTGISPRLLPRLFRLFEQGGSSIHRTEGGLGIGLALVKNFVELHGGSITVFSDGAGKGSEFSVMLPACDGAEPETEPASTGLDAPPSTARVLLVDDNQDALATLETYLQARGFDVTAASDPLQALELAEEFRPTVAVLDIGLPGMDGYELAARLKQACFPDPPRLLALTGYGQASDRERSEAAGFSSHLVKPVSLEKLVTAIAG